MPELMAAAMKSGRGGREAFLDGSMPDKHYSADPLPPATDLIGS